MVKWLNMTWQLNTRRATGLIWPPLGVLGLILCFLAAPVFAAKPATKDKPQAGAASSKPLSQKAKAPAEEPIFEDPTDDSARETPESSKSRGAKKPEKRAAAKKVAKEDLSEGVEAKTEAVEAVKEQLQAVTPTEKVKQIIGTTATVIEAQSQLLFYARVDTGATSCSVHFEEMEVEDESKKMEENVGKSVRVLLNNGADQTTWVESKIERCVMVKTSEDKERRYKVPMTFLLDGVEKTVVVTLNDRGHMRYPLLLGRNFLKGDFLVDAELNAGD